MRFHVCISVVVHTTEEEEEEEEDLGRRKEVGIMALFLPVLIVLRKSVFLSPKCSRQEEEANMGEMPCGLSLSYL